MDAQTFWQVIGQYNQQTAGVQPVLLLLLLGALALSYGQKCAWAAKAALGVLNLFMGFGFFALYGTQPVQTFFAMPLFLACGVLFLYEGVRYRKDQLCRPDGWQSIFLALYLLYPAVSFLLGQRFPQMTTHIMPCPINSLGIVVCTGYRRKNKLLLVLLVLWGLTGIKSVFFHVYEDLILFAGGIYGIAVLVHESKTAGKKQTRQ